jgi:glycosyltransferase involved in cell wall biosynthesis
MSEYQFKSGPTVPEAISTIFSDKMRTSASSRKPTVLMVGMHLTKTRGGITTLTGAILGSRLKDNFDFNYLASQAEELGNVGKLILAVSAAVRFFGRCLFKRPDLVYIHLGSNASLYRESVFIILAKLFRRKVLAHFHAGDVKKYYPYQSTTGQKFIRSAIGLSDRVIAVSQRSANELRSIVPSVSISVIPNVIDTSAFRTGQTRSKNEAKGQTVKLLFVGAVGKLKGEKDLIKALAILRISHPNMKVSFLGYGAEKLQSYCDALGVTDLVDHLGPVPMDKRLEFFHQADIFILPTYAEAMPISIIEAMASGLAIISTPVGGIPELIEDQENGLLFACGDIDALAQKIAFLIDNAEARVALGTRARQKVSEQMDFEAYLEKLGKELFRGCATDTKL